MWSWNMPHMYLEVVDLKIFTRDINTGPYSTHKACRALCSLRHKYLLIGNELLMKELPSNHQSVSWFNFFLQNSWCFVSFSSINSIQNFLRVNWAWLIFFLRMKETVFLIKMMLTFPSPLIFLIILATQVRDCRCKSRNGHYRTKWQWVIEINKHIR